MTWERAASSFVLLRSLWDLTHIEAHSSGPHHVNQRLPARVPLRFYLFLFPFLLGLTLGRTWCIFVTEEFAATAIWSCVSMCCMRETQRAEPSLGQLLREQNRANIKTRMEE